MKNLPETDLEWAKEAYGSLCISHILYGEEFSNSIDKDKTQLFTYAVPLAAENRGVEDDDAIQHAVDYVYDKLSHDINPIVPGEAVHYSIHFLNAYLDTHVVFNIITEEDVTRIMNVLDANYAIDIPI